MVSSEVAESEVTDRGEEAALCQRTTLWKKCPAQNQVSQALITKVRLGGVSDVNFLVEQNLIEGSTCQ